MEKVLVVKEVPGMLKIGDILVADPKASNGSFFLDEENGNVSRYVNIDYVTVSDNIPEYFEYVLDMKESEGKGLFRTPEEIEARLEFFQGQLEVALPGSEAEIVFTNLIWLIEWLKGQKNLLK